MLLLRGNEDVPKKDIDERSREKEKSWAKQTEDDAQKCREKGTTAEQHHGEAWALPNRKEWERERNELRKQ